MKIKAGKFSPKFWVVTLFLLFSFVTTTTNAQTCSLITQPGVSDSLFDSIFTQDGPGTGLEPTGIPGWTGADSTYSIELPNGDSAFFFSDSYVGQAPALAGDGTVTTDANGLRTRIANCGPPLCDPPTNIFRLHNSVIVRNKDTGALTTLTGPIDVNGFSTSFFVPPGAAATNHWYWMGDSAIVQTDAVGTKKLWVFLLEFDSTWTYYGSAIAQLSLPSMQIETIQPLLNPPTSNNINWGSALYLEGSYGNYTVYIYGIKTTGVQKRPYLAKINTAGSLLDVANMLNWQIWDGAGWSGNFLSAAPVIGNTGDPNNAADSISDEFDVEKLHTTFGDALVLVGMDTTPAYGTWKDITLYTACQPRGPFSSKKIVFTAPEANYNRVPGMAPGQTLAANMLVYNPHIHKQFIEKGRLLISYDINAGNSADLLFADTYRPRFVRVPIRGLRQTY
jgi:hypothetical protein